MRRHQKAILLSAKCDSSNTTTAWFEKLQFADDLRWKMALDKYRGFSKVEYGEMWLSRALSTGDSSFEGSFAQKKRFKSYRCLQD